MPHSHQNYISILGLQCRPDFFIALPKSIHQLNRKKLNAGGLNVAEIINSFGLIKAFIVKVTGTLVALQIPYRPNCCFTSFSQGHMQNKECIYSCNY